MLVCMAPDQRRPGLIQGEIAMKRILIVLGVALLLMGTAQAKVNLGIRAGLNVAKLELSQEGVDTRSALGLHIGGFLQLKTDSALIIQPELLYTQKGTVAEENDKVTIDYLALPVLLKLNVGIPGAGQMLIQPLLAPEIGYALSANYSGQPFLENINRLNAGFNLGADLYYSQDYFIGLRYYLGMTDLLRSSKRPAISNTCWTISAGYMF